MSYDQIFISCLMAAMLAMFVWGRWRYDLVAVGALLIAVLGGVVPDDTAFSGFGHPAVITVAAVLVISQALIVTGAIEYVAQYAIPDTKNRTVVISALCVVGAVLSGFMNNVGALALLMPLAIQLCARHDWSPAMVLMPLAFATILGGLLTLIGTPPNIIIAGYREEAAGAPFEMFDFLPVGVVAMAAGVAFIALVGWRLIPARRRQHRTQEEVFDIEDYVSEFRVPKDSEFIGTAFRQAEAEITDRADVAIVGMLRGDEKISLLPHRHLKEGDILILEAEPEAIARAASGLDLELVAGGRDVADDLRSDEVLLQEVVVTPGSRLDGETLGGFRLRARYRVNVIAVSREGQPHRGRLKNFQARAGDVLLLQGDQDRLPQVVSSLGLLPLARRRFQIPNPRRALAALLLFAVAIIAATIGWVSAPVALGVAALGMVLVRAIPTQELYQSIDWPVIVLLGALFPVGAALETSGTTALIAGGIEAISVGGAGVVALMLVMVVTMLLSAIVNNAATAVVMAPIAVNIAQSTGGSVDGFLMGVAISASCAFLTPIGHQNNTLVMGPGGYHFGDYWRMGLPLTALVLGVSVPAIALVWGV